MKELADLTAPAPITRKRLEKDVQKDCVDWMRGRLYWARKFSSTSQRSVPDYLFSRAWTDTTYISYLDDSRPVKIKFATEFKREGAPVLKETGCMSTEAQVKEQELMRQAGWYVFECSDFEVFKATVIAYEKEITQ